jgi:hypothetical protein
MPAAGCPHRRRRPVAVRDRHCLGRHRPGATEEQRVGATGSGVTSGPPAGCGRPAPDGGEGGALAGPSGELCGGQPAAARTVGLDRRSVTPAHGSTSSADRAGLPCDSLTRAHGDDLVAADTGPATGAGEQPTSGPSRKSSRSEPGLPTAPHLQPRWRTRWSAHSGPHGVRNWSADGRSLPSGSNGTTAGQEPDPHWFDAVRTTLRRSPAYRPTRPSSAVDLQM